MNPLIYRRIDKKIKAFILLRAYVFSGILSPAQFPLSFKSHSEYEHISWKEQTAIKSQSDIENTGTWYRNGLHFPTKKIAYFRDVGHRKNPHRYLSLSMRYKSSNMTSSNFASSPGDMLQIMKYFHRDTLKLHLITQMLIPDHRCQVPLKSEIH